MKELGVSVYPDFHTIESIGLYLEKAHQLGYTRVFTSLILANHGFENSKKPTDRQLTELFRVCAALGFCVTADINKEVFEEIGCKVNDLKPLDNIGIKGLRLDDGFSEGEICELTNNNFGIKIELSAAIAERKGSASYNQMQKLLELVKNKGKLLNITACHNFYPLIGTGMKIEDIRDINKLLKAYDITLGGFVASQFSPRYLHKNGNGVPTIEDHRYLPPEIAMQILFSEGFDFVLIGDARADDRELEAMAKGAKSEVLEIPVVFNQYINNNIKKTLFNQELTARLDQSAELIRASGSRGINTEPVYCAERTKYTVTICNSEAGHYMGELQISLKDMERSIEHNVIGFVHPVAVELLECIKYGRKPFKLVQY